MADLRVGDRVGGRRIVTVWTMVATAYGPSRHDNYPFGPWDAYGKPLEPGDVAVDPRVIPLGTPLYVSGYRSPELPPGGMFARARDTGGAIRGCRIDIFIDSDRREVGDFGLQTVTVCALAGGDQPAGAL